MNKTRYAYLSHIPFLEWPVYFDDRHKTVGNINILTITSNVVLYTLIIELYNFADNASWMRRIGLKLRAIFGLQVNHFVGCNQKSDFTKLCKQYPILNLPITAYSKMFDVSLMAVQRGIAKQGPNQRTLQTLCHKQGYQLPKPAHVRVGTCFSSKAGSLSTDAQQYCQLDVEAPLVLYAAYKAIPNLVLRLGNSPVTVGMIVDIMPASGISTQPIAQGVVMCTSGCMDNGRNIGKNKVLVKVEKVFDGNGIIHYPCTEEIKRKCACGRGSHGHVNELCNFYLYQQYGKPPFTVIEMKSRLRKHNFEINYGECIYSNEGQLVETNNNLIDFTQSLQDMPSILDAEETHDDNIEDGNDIISIGSNEESSFFVPLSSKDIEVLDQDAVQFLEEEIDNGLSGNNEESPTQMQEELLELLNDDIEQIISDADKLAQINNPHLTRSNFVFDDNQNVEVDEMDKLILGNNAVLGDVFHAMDRAKVPMHHDFKSSYFRALRSAVFIMHKGDMDDVKEVIDSKGDTTWNKKLVFSFSYIAQRVRRKVPPPDILHHRLKAVYNFFKDKEDSRTKCPLFNDRARAKFESVLELAKNGFLSDPPGLLMYVPKTDINGKIMIDKDGLTLYRSLRGTSNLESLHQYLTTSFGHTTSGPWYSDALLTILRHQYNWRMSLRNRPHFPKCKHYHELLIDRINEIYEQIYGHPKHINWISSDEALPLKSPFGVVAINCPLAYDNTRILVTDVEQQEALSKRPMLKYLAKRQQVSLPYVPIRGAAEKQLFHRLIEECLSNEQPVDNMNTFEKIAKVWTQNHVNVNYNIFPKLAIHLVRNFKTWRKNQARKDAEITSGAKRLYDALEHVPNTNYQINDASFQLHPIQAVQEEARNHYSGEQQEEEVSDRNGDYFDVTDNMMNEVEEDISVPSIFIPTSSRKRKNPKTCKGFNGETCPQKHSCPGRWQKANCILVTINDPSKKVKRIVRNQGVRVRQCSVCNSAQCKSGIRKRENCSQWQESSTS